MPAALTPAWVSGENECLDHLANDLGSIADAACKDVGGIAARMFGARAVDRSRAWPMPSLHVFARAPYRSSSSVTLSLLSGPASAAVRAAPARRKINGNGRQQAPRRVSLTAIRISPGRSVLLSPQSFLST